MNVRTGLLVTAVAAGLTLLVAAPAQAHPSHRAGVILHDIAADPGDPLAKANLPAPFPPGPSIIGPDI